MDKIKKNYGGTLTWKSSLVDSGICGADGGNVMWTLYFDGTLEFSGSGAMMSFEEDQYTDCPWYKYRDSVKNVRISPQITVISDYAFFRCSKLESVTIPEGVTELRSYVFYECSALHSISLPSSLKIIGNAPFFNCRTLSAVTIPDNVTSIGNLAFYGCSALERVTLPAGLSDVGATIFDNCPKLTSAGPAGGGYNIEFGWTTMIPLYAFMNCTSLSHVVVPGTITTVGYSFQNCTGLKTAGPIGGGYDYEFGWTTSIPRYAFWYCTALESVILPEEITAIGDSAFYYCQSLQSIRFPVSLVSTGATMFSGSGLKDVYYDGSEIEKSAMELYPFYLDPVLKNAVWHYKTTSVSGSCGVNGDELTWMLTPDGTLTISGSGAMADYTTASDTPWYRFKNLVKAVDLLSGVTTIGDSSFAECTELLTVTIPETVTEIGDSAFFGCSSLSNVVIPEGVETIGSSAFRKCTGMTRISIPESVDTIEENAFEACAALNNVIYGGIRQQWQDISIEEGNDALLNSEIHCRECTHPEKSIVIDPAVEPTETSTGLTEGRHCSICGEIIIAQEVIPVLKPVIQFTDVTDPGSYYYDAVYWAAENEITTGTSPTTFSPGDPCTRAQIVAFLWRAMGKPTPTTASNPFRDVKSSDWFYEPVMWAVENGITQGTSKTTFSPGDPCTRAQIVTFLWRAKGSPEPESTANPFKDVKTSDWFYKPVMWAVQNGITTGTSKTAFSPGKTCIRAQGVTFLYRAMG